MAERTVLFHVSDIHFGIEDRAAHAWFVDAVVRERPDAVICTGDLTQRATRRQFAAAQAWLANLGVPLFLEPGNHDLPYYNLVERFCTPFARYDALARAVASEPALDHVAVVALRTSVRAQWRWPWSDGVVRERALGKAVRRLDLLRGDSRLKIVACHHPLAGANPEGRNPTIHGEAALQALAMAGADVILSGHVHDAFDIVREIAGRKLRMVGTGTLSRRLRSTPPTYTILSVGADSGLSVEHRIMSGAHPAP